MRLHSYREVKAALAATQRFSTRGAAVQCGQTRPLPPLQSEGEAHRPARRVLDAGIQLALDDAAESSVLSRLDGLLRAAEGRGVDVNAEVCRPFGLHCYLDLMGFPIEDADAVGALHDRVALESSKDPLPAEEVRAAADSCYDYLRSRMGTERPGLSGGLAAHLLSATSSDSSGSNEVAMDYAYLLMFATVGTMSHALSRFFLFSVHSTLPPLGVMGADAQDRLFEELMRWASPVGGVSRLATADMLLEGSAVRSGERIQIRLEDANWDPVVFPAPEVVDPERRGPRHLAFGAGVHRCAGAALSHRILSGALRALGRYSITAAAGADLPSDPRQCWVASPLLVDLFRRGQDRG